MAGSSALLALAGTVSVIFFIAFLVLSGGKPLAVHFLGLAAKPRGEDEPSSGHQGWLFSRRLARLRHST